MTWRFPRSVVPGHTGSEIVRDPVPSSPIGPVVASAWWTARVASPWPVESATAISDWDEVASYHHIHPDESPGRVALDRVAGDEHGSADQWVREPFVGPGWHLNLPGGQLSPVAMTPWVRALSRWSGGP